MCPTECVWTSEHTLSVGPHAHRASCPWTCGISQLHCRRTGITDVHSSACNRAQVLGAGTRVLTLSRQTLYPLGHSPRWDKSLKGHAWRHQLDIAEHFHTRKTLQVTNGLHHKVTFLKWFELSNFPHLTVHTKRLNLTYRDNLPTLP